MFGGAAARGQAGVLLPAAANLRLWPARRCHSHTRTEVVAVAKNRGMPFEKFALDAKMKKSMNTDESTGPTDSSAPDAECVTRLLHAAAAGEPNASDRLYELLYGQLRQIARKRMAGARAGNTLQTTALVNEACIRLLGTPDAKWNGRAHFFAAAAKAMRQILIDHFRLKTADKRGGGRAALTISSVVDLAAETDAAGFLALDDAISRLEQVDRLAAAVVHLRFYTSLPLADTAEMLGVSERTARRAWSFARGWLRDALQRDLT